MTVSTAGNPGNCGRTHPRQQSRLIQATRCPDARLMHPLRRDLIAMPHLNLHSGFASAALAVAGIVTSLTLFAVPAAQAQPQPQQPAPAWNGGPGPAPQRAAPPPPPVHPDNSFYGKPGYDARAHGSGGPSHRGPVVRCESLNGRYKQCRVPFHGPVVLVRQLSDARCIPGRTYGTAKPGRIWVNGGCRGDFAPRRS